MEPAELFIVRYEKEFLRQHDMVATCLVLAVAIAIGVRSVAAQVMKFLRLPFIIAALGLAAGEASATDDALLIENVTLVDGTGKPPAAGMSLLAEGDRITRISENRIPLPDGATRIDGTGKFLIPGLIDVHIHLRGGMAVTEEGLQDQGSDFRTGISALQGYLYSGVTSIFDAGNIPDYIMQLRARERAGELTAPRIFATGGIVTYPGSHGSGPGATLVDDWPEAIPLLDEHIARQPDLVKFTLEERGWGARPMIPALPVDLLQKLVEYFNDHGIRSTIHTASEIRARQAIFAGVDTLAHPVIVGPITDNFARLMAAKQIPMATTLTIGENYSRLVEHPEYLDQPLYRATIAAEEIESLRGEVRATWQDRPWTWWMKIMTPIAQNNLRMIHEAGGVLALGTDQSLGPAVHREMELLVAAGIPAADVIKIATHNSALFLGKQNELGTIEIGKLADMVLLGADPTADINNVKDILTVIKGGVEIDRGQLDLPVNR